MQLIKKSYNLNPLSKLICRILIYVHVYIVFKRFNVNGDNVNHLKALKGLPISYLVSNPKKKKVKYLGKVGIGYGLSMHVSTAIYFINISQSILHTHTDMSNASYKMNSFN